eukprot:TRINITY_DN795_c0_g1_i2.p1 TRINITY_DN795_c0_g1~~TRINITY_DN795_c0_g1_i2.p1  ORF type:complete len:276 (-),score=-17.25 TRINITY_DN795_c0_g1_i2:2-829(-)
MFLGCFSFEFRLLLVFQFVERIISHSLSVFIASKIQNLQICCIPRSNLLSSTLFNNILYIFWNRHGISIFLYQIFSSYIIFHKSPLSTLLQQTLQFQMIFFSSCVGVFLLLSQNALCLIPNYYYDSFGSNILFNDEGVAVQTASGKDFLTGVSADTCAEACFTIGDVNYRCDCCNSFAYSPSTKTCYLKKRSNENDLSRYTASNGYQSYKFVSRTDYHYQGQLPVYIEGQIYYRGTADLYRMAFISKGHKTYMIKKDDKKDDDKKVLTTTSSIQR